MRVAVASERRPKVEAVRRAIARISQLDPSWSNVELLARSTESGVSATPVSDVEMRQGARQRVLALHETLLAGQPASASVDGRTLAVGLEGGLHVEQGEAERHVWLRGWACASDGVALGWGCGPSIELPHHVAQAVLDGEDLAAVIDRVSGETDVRSRGGTWGILTRDLLVRTETFEAAVLAAFSRFYNAAAYAAR